MESTENSQEPGVLDLSKRCLKKIPKMENSQSVRVLILDDNELQKIDNIDSYLKIEKLSLCKNQLLRMYGVSRLHHLRELDLSFNGILTIEALKECTQLTHLNLERNNIKSIEHLNTNVKLEYLNLSENSIGIISDISFLKCLKELYLHGNRITHLRQCDRYLPTSLEVLTLAKNNITDLNEICTLSNLMNLNSITITDNPCVQMTGGSSIGFDYRPFLLNWCMSVKIIDGFVVNPIESLKAEWLYSQGKGRSFRVGEQQALALYLSQTCPLSGEALENENERKLRLILSKAQQHQRQLQEQIVSGGSNPTTPNNSSSNNSPSSLRRKGPSRIQSPRITRLSGRPNSADAMSSSYHGNMSTSMITSTIDSNHSNQLLEMTKSLIENFTSDNMMSQSLDPTILSSVVKDQPSPVNNGNLYNDQSTVPIVQSSGPLAAASKMMPVPESLMSPDCGPVPIIQQKSVGVSGLTTSTTNYTVTQSTVKTTRTRDNRASSKSPRPSNKRSDSQKSQSPQPQSPRKSISNITNTKIHQQQHHSIMKQHIQHTTPSETASSVMSSEEDDEDDDSDKINVEKLKSIRKTAQKCQKQKENQHQIQTQKQVESMKQISNKETENSVILIQKLWRGYSTRKKTKSIADILQKKRTQDYIMKLSQDMEMTKQALENERKIQQLQMQAINALWKKISTMQVDGSAGGGVAGAENVGIPSDSSNVVQDLTKTCTVLTNQVQQLQLSMRDILNCMTLFASLPQNAMQQQLAATLRDTCETQTEIVAVHTPQIENPQQFPFMVVNKPHHVQRPSTLPISSSNDSSASTKSSHNTAASNTNPDDFDHKLLEQVDVEHGEEVIVESDEKKA